MRKNIDRPRLIGTFVRLIRFMGAVLSLVLLPFWYLLATRQHYLPDFLSYIGPKDIGEIPLLVQIINGGCWD